MRLRAVLLCLSGLILLSGCLPDKPEMKWQLALDGIYSAAMTRQGKAAVIGSHKHGGSYWDLANNERLFNWNHKEGFITEILYSDLSEDGRYSLTANYYNIVLWDTETGESVWFWSAPARIEAVDLSADGRFALLGLNNNKAVLFDIVNGGVLREFEHGGPVISVSLNVPAGWALTGSEDTSARLWNLPDAKLIRSFDFKNHISLVKLSESGNLALMVPANEKAELWNLRERRKITNLSTAKFRLYSAKFVGDSRLIVGTTHRNIFEFDTKTGDKTHTWQLGTEGKQAFKAAIVMEVAWRGSQLLAIGSNGYLYAF